jgi:YVTN family beta-propeller protein
VNGGAETGDASAQGWDAVTIPGWQIERGLPTVVRYGTRGFPGRRAGGGSGKLFAGGAGGTAVLAQRIPVRTAAGRPSPAGATFQLAARLGGTGTSSARLRVVFRSARGTVLGSAALGPVGHAGSERHPLFARRQASGRLPAGTVSAALTLRLATTRTNWDGYNSPLTGYDRAVADGIGFSVSFPAARPPALAPPPARVPGYDHVFLFYFENQDYRDIVGNTAQAPYLNSLIRRGSLLSQVYAEEHPSDGNYLALAGGSTFGIPLTNPLEINPRYTIRARNLPGLVSAVGKSWKGYYQSANGPCDDTVHRNYWDDDLPFLYFADIRDRPAYCAAHLPPLATLPGDLRSPVTTPNLAWIGPDDCADMEGCGIRAGDDFLRQQLRAIMRSPAWRTQRSLAIVTFDEDNFDHEHPAQRVATLVLGSRGVHQGYVSPVRYTHYSLLRTIEAALGLPTLTANDRYAPPVNDVFTANPAVPSRAGSGLAQHPTAFVANSGSGTVTPVDLITLRKSRPIPVGRDPEAIALTPDGRTAYVVNRGSGTVTPISTGTRRAGRPIRVGSSPRAIVITPDGRTAYVANAASGTVTPITLATGRAGPPVRVRGYPLALAVTPDGRTVYAVSWLAGTVTPITVDTNRAGQPIRTGSYPVAITMAPGGRTAYVVNFGSNTVTPVAVSTNTAGRPIPAGQAPSSIAITRDGAVGYVADGDTDVLTPIRLATGTPGRPIPVGYSPAAAVLAPGGRTVLAVNTISGTLTLVSTITGRPGRSIGVGLYGYPLTVAVSPDSPLALVLDTYSGQVRPVNLAAGRALRRIHVGAYPLAAVIAP